MRHRVKILQMLAIILTALALVPGGAHLFSLPHKIGMARDNYFVVQAIYRGWALFGILIIAALVANEPRRRSRLPLRSASPSR
jgi:hypothetical protein